MAEENLAWFAGVDWGSERHQECVVDAHGNIVGEREFTPSGEGLAELGDWLLSIAGAKDDRRDAYVLGDGVRTDRACSAGFMSLIRGSSNCAPGRGLPRN